MEALASSDFKSDFWAVRNHIALLLAAAAPNIDMSNAGPYDQGLNELPGRVWAIILRVDSSSRPPSIGKQFELTGEKYSVARMGQPSLAALYDARPAFL